MNNCPLCRIYKNKEIHTKVHFEDNSLIILDCHTCKNVPMLVIKRHDMILTHKELEHILKVVKKQFPNYKLRMNQRQEKNHWHIHLVKP